LRLITANDLLSEWCSSGADMINPRMGHTMLYFLFGDLIEASLMRRYHNKLADESLISRSIKKRLNLCRVRHLNLNQPALTIWIAVYE